MAAAVILPEQSSIPYLNDSKQVTAKRREILYDEILAQAESVAWSSVSAPEIDRLNIYAASRLAMMQALSALSKPFDLVLSDAMPLPDLPVSCIPIVHGDALSASIAAASIIAKVTRDRMMEDFDKTYPGYGFASHKGYGTAGHLAAIEKLGPCSLHRRSFAPIKNWRLATGED